jgi:phospholipase C
LEIASTRIAWFILLVRGNREIRFLVLVAKMISRRKFLSALGAGTAAGVAGGCAALTATTSNKASSSPASLQANIDHIIFTMQENRSFDHYFGRLQPYRSARGIPGTVDGFPANASNPAADNPSQLVLPHHLSTSCHEDLSPSWNETRVDYNRSAPNSSQATMDGFVLSAAKYSRENGGADIEGHRAMGFYTEADLPFYYELASQFAISDRFFSASPAETLSNRLFQLAGSAFGRVYPDVPEPQQYNEPTIFDLLEKAGISWKIYVNGDFTYYQWFVGSNMNQSKIVGADHFFSDLTSGALPAVSMIESGPATGMDEHPINNIQRGAKYIGTFINALLSSAAWPRSVFLLNYDEAGGFYDHVPPPPAPQPDNIAPILKPGDIPGSFDRYGFRVPLIMISSWAQRNFVSHIVADHTSILRFIETRFGLQPLTARDAAAHDLLDMLDFSAASFSTPPSLPVQPELDACDDSGVDS